MFAGVFQAGVFPKLSKPFDHLSKLFRVRPPTRERRQQTTMMNQVYQTTAMALEAVLSPRVVSRSLNEGLRQVDKTPENVEYDDIEKVLKSHIYKQLQVALPAEKAKETIKEILAELSALHSPPEPETPPKAENPLEQQQQNINALHDAIRPFNLYFEWPETQKLRAQLQLLDQEQEAGNDAGQLIASAHAQLKTLEQKLEDLLVEQADELSKLQAALEQVRSLGGFKVRRLENLMRQINEAQGARQLAGAEVDRARKLASDLRKLLQSSVVGEEQSGSEKSGPEKSAKEDSSKEDLLLDLDFSDPIEAETSNSDAGDLFLELDESDLELAPEASADIKSIDIESERHTLDSLAKEYSNLLNFVAALQTRVDTYRQQLEQGDTLGEALPQLRQEFEVAQGQQRDSLRQELQALKDSLAEVDASIDNHELSQALQVTLGVLEATLPSESDVKHIRDLQRLLEQRVEALNEDRELEASSKASKLEQQAQALDQLRIAFNRHEPSRASASDRDKLAQAIAALEHAQADNQLNPEAVREGRQAVQSLESNFAQRAEGKLDKQRAWARSMLSQVRSLPLLESVQPHAQALEASLENRLQTLEHSTITSQQRDADAAKFKELKTELKAAYRDELKALSERARELQDKRSFAHIQLAVENLEKDEYPDLSTLARPLKQSFSELLANQTNDLHQLESEAQNYRNQDSDEARELQRILQDARAQIEQRQPAEEIDRAWLLLEQVRSSVEERSASFAPRLDRALKAFEPVAKLNTDEVTNVKRILQHLNGQRNSFDKVSTTMQAQLINALAEAEDMIENLQKEFEATRDIAGKLVSSSLLDDVLGIFGSPGTPPPSASSFSAPRSSPPLAATASATPTSFRYQQHSGQQRLDAWLEDYIASKGIREGAMFTPENSLYCGSLQLSPGPLIGAVVNLEQDLQSLGHELSLGAIQLFSIEAPQGILVILRTPENYRVVLVVSSPAELSLVLNKLRRDAPILSDIIHGTAVA